MTDLAMPLLWPRTLHGWLPCVAVLLPAIQATRHSPDLSSSTHKDVTRKYAGPGVHFVSPRLDYCNSPFYGITEGPIR